MATPPTVSSATELTRELVRHDTVNPPGRERACAEYLGERLEAAGFSVTYDELPYDTTNRDTGSRCSVVARLEGVTDRPPLCWTGHLDTVPLGRAAWSVDPFGGELADGRLYGRGSTDMKAGVAACVAAASELARSGARPRAGLTLVLTAGEETGCDGAHALASKPEALGTASALVVGEPTSNRLFVGHKGALWLRARASGRTAHGSMPEQGDNAISKAARAVTELEQFRFDVPAHPWLGGPTLNVGTFAGGLNVNSVPDEATFEIDVRTIPGQAHDRVRERVRALLGRDLTLDAFVDVESLFSEPDDPWIARVQELVAEVQGETPETGAASYFTDGAVLSRAYGGIPTAVLGPGEPSLAHQTDEYCLVDRIERATAIYRRLFQHECGW